MEDPSSEDDFASNNSSLNLLGEEIGTRKLNVVRSV